MKKLIAPTENYQDAPLIQPAQFASAWSSVLIAHLAWMTNEASWDGDATEALRAAQQMSEILILLGLEIMSQEGTMPIGAISMYGGAAAPTGWLLCDGAAISRATYAALFAVVGTVFGAGDGSTTFNILDLRGRLALGKDNMGGSSANRVTATEADNLGQGSGAENHTLVVGEMPAHTHRERHNAGDAFEFFASGGSNYDVQATAATTNTVPRTTGSFGGGGAHNNMPPYLTLNFIIAYE